MRSTFIKAAAVVKSCVNQHQLETAIRYIHNAGRKDYINAKEWDLLFYHAQEKAMSLYKCP